MQGTKSVVADARSTFSGWEEGPGTVSYDQTAPATCTVSESHGFTVSDLIRSANATFGISVASSSSHSASWSYRFPLACGQYARIQV